MACDLHGFVNICKLPVAQTLKVMQSKILKKVVFHKFFKFSFYKVAKKLIVNVPLVVQITIFCNLCKMLKSPENLKILKNDGHFRIPHPQNSL